MKHWTCSLRLARAARRQSVQVGPCYCPTHTQRKADMLAELLDHHDTAPEALRAEGAQWYPQARAECRRLARRHGVTEARAAGIVAALSPRMPWARNIAAADDILTSGTAAALGRSVVNANAIREGARPLDVLRGPKTRAFYRNLTGDLDTVTVDVWAARAAKVDERTLARKGTYDAVADAYRAAAAQRNTTPAAMQAIVWCAVRGSAS